ncbi:exodeoxyribonuclease VII small subunit [Dorea sp.]|nr:exodeoxyribonuclease VII small subunit [uncultured Dorea sp.]
MAENEQTIWEEMNLEEIFEKLESTMKKMEEEDISLEESFQLYHQGMDMLKACNDKIDKVEKKMLLLDEEGEEHEF